MAVARPPRVTQVLIAVNVAVFASMALAGAGVMRPDPFVHIAWGSNFAPLTVAGQWWRLATSAFLHFGLMHLAFNMWALWVSGSLVEHVFGRGRFVLLYAIAAVFASLASAAWNPLVNSAGASGAIFGVLGAQLAFFLSAGHGIPPEVVRTQRASTLGFIGYSVVFGFLVPGIDNAAHLGGLAAGLCLGWVMVPPRGPSGARAGSLRVIAAATAGAVLVGAGAWAALSMGNAHAAEQAYLRAWQEYAQDEGALVERTNALMGRARSGELADAEVADALATDIAPAWRARRDRIAAPALPPSSPLHAEQSRLVDITGARAEGFAMMASALRSRDRAAMEQAIRLLERAGRLAMDKPAR